MHRSSAAVMILTGRRVYYTVIKNLPSCAFPPDSDWRAGPGHPRRVVPLAGSRGPRHHGDGSAPILPQLLPENPACSVGAGRPSASPLEAVHRSDGQKRPLNVALSLAFVLNSASQRTWDIFSSCVNARSVFFFFMS